MYLLGALLLLAVLLGIAAARLWGAAGRANEVDWGHDWVNRLDGLNRLFCRYFHRLPATSRLKLPEAGAALVAANHVSGLDPLLLIAASRRPLRFIIAAEQYHRPLLNRLFRAVGCIPVDRQGRPERAYRSALSALKRGEVVALFPGGGIHPSSQPPRRLKPGIARMAQLGGCPVFPVRLEGVRAEGHVMLAPLVRSHARLVLLPPLDCHEAEPRRCLETLGALLHPTEAKH